MEINVDVRVSVRNLVEFILRSGDIDNRRRGGIQSAMLEGGRIHRMIQRRMGSNYQSEVKLQHCYKGEEYDIVIEGRADGIIDEGSETQFTIDEIKGTYQDIHRMKEPSGVHVAQAKCYAYMYGIKKKSNGMQVRITYCNMDSEEIRYFYFTYTMEELETWFVDLVQQYKKWADLEYHWKEERITSIQTLGFPFPYREGQKELITHVYQTMYHKRKLFIEAPTGVGKTISTIFPAVKSMGQGRGDKLFYFTAKTITRTVAEDTFQLLRNQGLRFKSVTLTAKDKICFLEESNCNPVACPYAKGHFDRINEALYDLVNNEIHYSREMIEEYARKHRVCPFEMCLDASLFADGIIGDYNYLFDPHVYLKRFFAEGTKGEHLFLVDEAHNLLERGREMYSAMLCKEDFLALKKEIKLYDKKIEYHLEKCNRQLLHLKRECETYQVLDSIDSFVLALNRLATSMDEFLEKQDESIAKDDVLDFYFQVTHFLMIYEKLDHKYTIYSEFQSNGEFIVKLLCVDPSTNLAECLERGRSSILFSATLLPIQYYKRLLGGNDEDYEVYANSTFLPAKKLLLVANNVTSKYTRRSHMEFYHIAKHIYEIINKRHGNYMVFFPSHQFLKQVSLVYEEYFLDVDMVEIMMQEEYMDELERELFLKRFVGNPDIDFRAIQGIDIEVEDKSLVGFCVLGGIFSEGIDLKYDSLIGAIIIGTGLPQVCTERELIKSYFDKRKENGFEYAYQFPGMNKVLQSAGRVIRTNEDVGIVALLDERFLAISYQKLFPREWETYQVVDQNTIGKEVEKFWNEWL
ncbi:MAG: ATP-dependent DNA helicase [Eubacteriales bacterium]